MPCSHFVGWWWWCNGVGDVFLAHFRPLSANWSSFKCHGLPKHCLWPCPSLYGHHVPILMATSSRLMHHITNHFKLVSWTWQWVHCTKMAPTVNRSQTNRASLGCGVRGVRKWDRGLRPAACNQNSLRSEIQVQFPANRPAPGGPISRRGGVRGEVWQLCDWDYGCTTQDFYKPYNELGSMWCPKQIGFMHFPRRHRFNLKH